MNFKDWIINEISEKTILYHRSSKVFDEGEILEPYAKNDENHWLHSQYTEKMLEKFREKYASDKPSRFNCIYCSVVPRSIFLTKGQLYEVRPIGNFHVALAYYVNEINHTFEAVPTTMIDRIVGFKDKLKVEKFKWEYNKEQLLELFNKYWNTKVDITTWKDDGLDRPLKPFHSKEYEGDAQSNFRKDPKWIEVLCEKVQIIKKVKEKEKTDVFRVGNKIEFIDDVRLEHYGYDESGNVRLSKNEIDKMINDFDGTKSTYGVIFITIKRGTKGTVMNSRYGQTIPNKLKSRLPFDNVYSKNIYDDLRIKLDGYNFSVTLRPHEHGQLHKIIKKI